MPGTLSNLFAAGHTDVASARDSSLLSEDAYKVNNTLNTTSSNTTNSNNEKPHKEKKEHPYQNLVTERKEFLAAVQPTDDEVARAHSLLYVPTSLPPLSEFLRNPAETPYPVWALGVAFGAGLVARVRHVRGWPHPFVLGTGAVASALIGSLVYQDPVIGSSTVASWSLIWTLLVSRHANRSYQVGPRLLNYAVLANGLLYGSQFISYMRM